MSNYIKITKFVLHEHKAIRAGLHYDLRIKEPGKEILISFALPKSKIPKKNEKFLAIKTTPHKMKWLDFEGHIKEGNYGHGDIKIIQKGICEVHTWNNRLITFVIEDGSPMNGKYHLIKTKSKRAGEEHFILLMGKSE